MPANFGVSSNGDNYYIYILMDVRTEIYGFINL